MDKIVFIPVISMKNRLSGVRGETGSPTLR